MRRHEASALPLPAPIAAARSRSRDWATVRTLLPYLWEYRVRVVLALMCLVAAKLANVGVPLVMKNIVDALTPGQQASQLTLQLAPQLAPQLAQLAPLVLPAALLVAYGFLRLSTTLFTELRELIFSRVTQRAVRKIALQVFRHLHALSLRFHLARHTGGLTRDIERGTRGISSLISFTLFSILPTLIEIGLVAGVLLVKYEWEFVGITFGTLIVYIAYTIGITEWRTNFRRTMNELDSKANTRAIDSLLNYETVKYFGNEKFEAERYDESMQRYERAAVKSQSSLSLLNIGQSTIIAIGVTLIMWRATAGVVEGRLSLGDLVLVNAFMIQLYIPLNFLGVVYREIKQSVADMERLFALIHENAEVRDAPTAKALDRGAGDNLAVAFEHVHFGYEPDRQILFDVDFAIPPGQTCAVVGPSGSGKSTLARLLYRFYDVGDGRITINGQDIRAVKQASLRAEIGIVPQDTVLFNDTIEYNIGYGKPDASKDEIIAAARSAHIYDFIASTPQGMNTMVGERGLKLSGGEKQRVAIARAILKNPRILIFDEATSALDSNSEKAIQAELKKIAENRTTLVIAHRLSTIVEADMILVLDRGRIVERGTFGELVSAQGVFAQMWALQQEEAERTGTAAA